MKFLSSSRLFLFSSLLLVLAMCFPQSLHFFVFFFFVPIFFEIYSKKKSFDDKKNVTGLFLKMFLFASSFVAVSTLWVVETYPLDWLHIQSTFLGISIVLLTWFLFIFFISIPVSFWGVIVFRYGKGTPLYQAMLGSSLWVILEYLRSWLSAFAFYGNETLFGPHHTYYSLAYTVSGIPFLRDTLATGGIYLVSFIIILSNYIFYYVIYKEKKVAAVLFFIVLLLIGGSSYYMKYLRKVDTINDAKAKVIVVNTYVPPITQKEKNNYKDLLAVSLLRDIKPENTIVVFPENFDPYTDNMVPNNSNLIIGSFKGNDYYNMFFWGEDRRIEYYRKQLLMPIGEYKVSGIGFIINIFKNKNQEDDYLKTISQSKKDEGVHLFSYKNFKIGGSLCSENISPYIYRNEVLSGANLLINIASLAPFHGSSLLDRQTLAINTARAIEGGRYFVTASNYSRSFVIADTGELLKISEGEEKSSWFYSDILPRRYITPYVKYGDYIVVLCLIYITLCFIWLFKIKI